MGDEISIKTVSLAGVVAMTRLLAGVGGELGLADAATAAAVASGEVVGEAVAA